MGVAFDPFRHRYFVDPLIPEQERIPAANLLAGAIIHVAHGVSTVHAEMDFETYSEAGHKFDPEKGKFVGIGSKKGLSAVGAAAYAQHASTEILCLAYNLKDGLGPRLWYPGDPLPWDLFGHIQRGGLIEAHNSIFEYFIWTYVCVKKLGWPELNFKQLRCSMSKAAAFALPMALDKLTAATDAPVKKDKEGQALMRKLSQPKAPTAKNKSLRYTRAEYPAEHARVGQYCITDTIAESEVSAMLPDLQPEELDLWLLDQQINIRGVHIDKVALDNCISIVEQAFARYSEELKLLCGQVEDEDGELQWRVTSPAELDNIREFLEMRGIKTASLDKEHVAKLLQRDDLPPDVRRVVEIRDMLSASSVKKLFSLLHHLCDDDRVRGLFAFCGADRTGRFAGRGPQPQNMPGSGPTFLRCDKINGCGHHYRKGLTHCPWCNTDAAFSEPKEWGPDAVDQALKVIASRNLHYVEHYFGDAIAVVSGCLRGLFTAAPGKDLISSDFSAIEAVVLAELAGESWRQEVFRTHGKIYEMGAAMITGTPFEEFMRVAGYPDISKEGWWHDEPAPGAKHHPLRKTIGKVSELASGYAGWIGAWKNFGADKFMNDQEIKNAILAWRKASPMIEELWGGQWRKHPSRWEFTPEYFGLEGAAIQAVMNPGIAYQYRYITYQCHADVLYCRLPSGRLLSYHKPRLVQSVAPHKNPIWQLTYMGQDEVGRWIRLNTYGGKLTENVTQAVARDILTFAMKNLEAAGYPIVLHIHDEIVCEVDKGWGSVEELERIMARMPEWCKDWPVRAAGGWRGLRYRKG
jgi:DNA polymerase